MKSENDHFVKKKLDFLHFSVEDLDHSSKNKAFGDISLEDFNYCVTDAYKAEHIFFVDDRQPNSIRRILGMKRKRKMVKQLK